MCWNDSYRADADVCSTFFFFFSLLFLPFFFVLFAVFCLFVFTNSMYTQALLFHPFNFRSINNNNNKKRKKDIARRFLKSPFFFF